MLAKPSEDIEKMLLREYMVAELLIEKENYLISRKKENRDLELMVRSISHKKPL